MNSPLQAFFLLLLFCLISPSAFAQTRVSQAELDENVQMYNEKINELTDKHIRNGFRIVQEGRIPMRDEIHAVLKIPLHEGNWYHFVMVGDPSADKIRCTLFLEGWGDLIQDKLIVRRTGEYWTEFSYMCLQSGIYEMDLFQKGPIPKPLAYIMVFQKQGSVDKP